MKNEPKDKTNTQKIKIYLGAVIIFICILIITVLVAALVTRSYKVETKHTTTNKIDYKAYLLKGTPFLEEYKLPGETIVAQALDYIDLEMSYSDEYDYEIVGSYSYYTKATVEAMKKSASKVDYAYPKNLTDPKVVSMSQVKNYNITDNVRVSYNEFNEILNAYKREFPYSMDGYVKIELLVKRDIFVPAKDVTIKDKDFVTITSIEIPLSEQVIDISIDNNTKTSTSVIKTETMKKEGIIYIIAIPTIVIMVAISLIVAIKLLEYIKNNEKTYVNKLNRILSTYDSVIVRTNNIPSIDGIDVLEVQTFEELIDAHSEVRQPINFFEDKKHHKSYFILHNGNSMAWKYVLRGKSPNKKEEPKEEIKEVKEVKEENDNK